MPPATVRRQVKLNTFNEFPEEVLGGQRERPGVDRARGGAHAGEPTPGTSARRRAAFAPGGDPRRAGLPPDAGRRPRPPVPRCPPLTGPLWPTQWRRRVGQRVLDGAKE